MGIRRLGVWTIVLLLATAGFASAQEATFSLNVKPASSSTTVDAGASSSVSVDVNLQGDGFSCAENEELPVNLTIAQTRGVSGSADPNPLIFSNTQGIHSSSAPSGPYNETQTATVSISAASTASSGDRSVQIQGVFPGGNYGASGGGSCEPGNFPSAEDSATVTVTVRGSDGGTSTNGTDGGTGTGGTDGGTGSGGGSPNGSSSGEENGTPVGAWVAPLALIGGALAARRRT